MNKKQWAWCFYDFANSAFTTLIVTFIYATYFEKSLSPDSATGTAYWSLGVSLTALVIALSSPFIGALADKGGFRKRFLFFSTLTCVIATVMLYFPLPYEAGGGWNHIYQAVFWFTVGNIAFEMGIIFYNSFLTDITPESQVGKISGWGWGLGYLGGLLCMGAALFLFVQNNAFGLDESTGQHIRATNLLVAVWYLLFAIPFFLVVADRKVIERPKNMLKGAIQSNIQSFRDIKDYKEILRFLIAHMVYNDGLVTIFAFGAIYASGTFGFSFTEVMYFGIALNVFAGLGAFIFGFFEDNMGGKKTIMISIVGLSLATLLAIFAPNKTWFWVAGIVVGIFAGPNQSASRALMSRISPRDKETELFGFYALAGKATAFIGPALLGVITFHTGSQRMGIAVVLLMFVIGGFILNTIDEQAAIVKADRNA